MLSGKRKLSVAEVYFIVEDAYGSNYLSKEEFSAIIKELANFIRSWMKENGLELNNNGDVHLAIQKFMGENLSITTTGIKDNKRSFKTLIHHHFIYDYEDIDGAKDYRSLSLSKCLATGAGQCSSMPSVYLVLAEALGVKAYLTTASEHGFIKYLDKSGNIINYEPTSNWKMSDKWYMDNMAVSAEAKRNRLYLDTFNSRQVVADRILSLAFSYMKQYAAVDERFVIDCITTADAAFAHKNIQALLIRSSLLARMLNDARLEAGLENIADLANVPQTMQLYHSLQQNEDEIKKLGYRSMPRDLYESLLKEHEFKGRVQDSLAIDGKQKRNLFMEMH